MQQYNLGHPENLARIDSVLEKYYGLALAGNGYPGFSIPDCIHSGELVVEKVTRELSRQPAKATCMSQYCHYLAATKAFDLILRNRIGTAYLVMF